MFRTNSQYPTRLEALDQSKISVEDIAPFSCIVYIKTKYHTLLVYAAETRSKEESSSIKYTEIVPKLAYRHQSLISRSLLSQSLIQVKENRPRQLSKGKIGPHPKIFVEIPSKAWGCVSSC